MKELIDTHPNLFVICVIIMLTATFLLLNKLEKWLDNIVPTFEKISMRDDSIIRAKLRSTYINGKVFQLKEKFIITDLDNKEIPCLELEMLQTTKN